MCPLRAGHLLDAKYMWGYEISSTKMVSFLYFSQSDNQPGPLPTWLVEKNLSQGWRELSLPRVMQKSQDNENLGSLECSGKGNYFSIPTGFSWRMLGSLWTEAVCCFSVRCHPRGFPLRFPKQQLEMYNLPPLKCTPTCSFNRSGEDQPSQIRIHVLWSFLSCRGFLFPSL